MNEFPSDELPRLSTRKRIVALIQNKPLIQGSLVSSLRTCGTKSCKCHHGGEKHSATYLSIKKDKKRTMVFIPQHLLSYVEKCVNNHKQLQKALEIISRDSVDILLSKKQALKIKK